MNSQKSESIFEQEINSLPGPSVKPENSQIETIKRVKKLTPKALQFKSEEFKKKFEKEIKLTDTAIRNLRLTIIISEVGKEIRDVSILANKSLDNVKGVLEELQSLVKESEYKELEGKYLELQNSFDKALEKAQAAMERLTAKAQGNLSVKSRRSDASTCSRSSKSTKKSLLKRRIEKLEQALKAQSDLQERSKKIEDGKRVAELEAGENACDISLPPTETEMERQSRILSALEGPSQERLVNNPAPGRRIIESSHYQPIQAPNFPSAFYRIPDVKVESFVSSVKKEIDLLQNSRDLCARAGLKLHEVVSNKLEVLECLPESDRATSKSFNIRTDSLPLERALGVVWCIQNDTFQFRIDTRNKVYCSFILNKARVASLKQVTFPRSELTAAVVSANKIL